MRRKVAAPPCGILWNEIMVQISKSIIEINHFNCMVSFTMTLFRLCIHIEQVYEEDGDQGQALHTTPNAFILSSG